MVHLRKATPEDLDLLEYWDGQDHVIAADPDPEGEDWEHELQRNPSWREYLIAEVGGKSIGFIQIIDPFLEETHYWGDIGPNKRAIDIWIGEKEYLNKGYGTQMMKQAIERCFKPQEVDEVLIDPLVSNIDAIRFYKRLGFEFVEQRKFGNDECEVYSLKRSKRLTV